MAVVRQTNDTTMGLLCFQHPRLNYGNGVRTQFPFRIMTLSGTTICRHLLYRETGLFGVKWR